MCLRYLLRFSFIISIFFISAANFAQDQSQLVVGVIVDDGLNTLSFSGDTSNGIRQLASIFQSFGAELREIDLSRSIDDDIDVLVLVRPQSALNGFQLARIWTHLDQGHNLLIALDPRNYNDVSGEDSGRGISRLLGFDYGISLQNDFLAERWFTTDSIENVKGSTLLTHPEDIIAHPIVSPLLSYQLPIRVWGGRSLHVEPFIPDSTAAPLLYTETAYGEVNANFAGNPQPLLLTLADDNLGRLLVGAIAENSRTRSKVVLLGDSEVVQDAFGLSQFSGTTRAQFIGNRIFAQRLAAWLLNIPESEWPALPQDYTWLTVDGRTDDWGDLAVGLQNADPADGFNLQAVQAFRNDHFMYFLLETSGPPNQQVQVEITLSGGNETAALNPSFRINLQDGGLIVGENALIPDAAIAVEDAIEIRLPLRVISRNSEIASICLFNRENLSEPQGCVSDVIPIQSGQIEPVPVRFPPGPLATVASNGPVNLSSAPDDNAPFIGVAQNDEVFFAAGRSEDARWIKVENGRLSAWIPDFFAALNTDIMTLPVIQ